MNEIKEETDFYQRIRHLERQILPEFFSEDFFCPPNQYYVYFAPSWHFRSGLLSKALVDDIRDNNRQILSVGSGKAYLERFLVEKLGIKNGQITLSDNQEVMPDDFRQFIFDMHSTWPSFGINFDYVLFPESNLLNARYNGNPQRQAGLYHLISNSLNTMNPTGQIRINGCFQTEENVRAVEVRLKRRREDLKLEYNQNLLVIGREY